MRANELKIRLSVLALAAMSMASAGAQNAPAATPSNTATPVAVQAPATPAAPAALALPVLPPVGSPVVTGGQPLPGARAAGAPSTAGKDLTYRDPSTPLSIEEVSDLQAKKANSEMYKKYGLTDVPPPKPVVVPVVSPEELKKEAAKAAPVIIPKLQVVSLGAWARSGQWRAEALVDGHFRDLRVGDSLSKNAVVKSISRNGIEVEVTPVPKKRAVKVEADEVKPAVKRTTSKAKSPSPVKTKVYWAKFGQTVEMPL